MTHTFKQLVYTLAAQMVKGLPAVWRPGFDPWVGKMPWRRKWQSTPVFLPGKSHGWRSLVGYCPWGRKELGDDWATSLHFIYPCRPFSSPQNSLLFPSETTLSRKSVFHQQFIWGIFHNLHSSASFLKRLYIISPYGHSRTDWARGALTFRWADKALAGVWLKVTQ